MLADADDVAAAYVCALICHTLYADARLQAKSRAQHCRALMLDAAHARREAGCEARKYARRACFVDAQLLLPMIAAPCSRVRALRAPAKDMPRKSALLLPLRHALICRVMRAMFMPVACLPAPYAARSIGMVSTRQYGVRVRH